MKRIFLLLFALATILIACTAKQNNKNFEKHTKLLNDTIRISNEEVEYEVIIIDPGFASWLNSFARPKNYYSQSYMEARNRMWVMEWNRRFMLPMQYNQNFYEMRIDYENNINYGYEVNYLIFNYLVYFQLTYNQQLGSFVPRI